MTGRPVKHSITLRGHRTSVSLEAAFWDAFRAMARADGVPIATLAARIDAARDPEVGLASALRVYVLTRLQSELARKDEAAVAPDT